MDHTVESILHAAKSVAESYSKLEKLRGDRFNVFKILGLQSNENRTHSAFLAELLNPNGDHLKDDLFLKHFLSCLNINDFDTDSITVILEKHIGKKNMAEITGGRIDIYIEDRKSGKTICIENKINAGDQEKQIERYCNFNKGKNTVLYLTLDGKRPGNLPDDLKEGKDFSCISYGESIKGWLELCIKESYDIPILRETIKQYIILINRLTGHISNSEMEQQLNKLILENTDVAFLIYQNFESAMNKFKNELRDEVASRVREGININYGLVKGYDVSKHNSQLWVEPVHFSNTVVKYGLETFSGKGFFENKIIYGLFSAFPERTQLPESLSKLERVGYWLQFSEVRDSRGGAITLNKPEYIKLLYRDKDFREETIQCITTEFLKYFNETNGEVLNFLKKEQIV